MTMTTETERQAEVRRQRQVLLGHTGAITGPYAHPPDAWWDTWFPPLAGLLIALALLAIGYRAAELQLGSYIALLEHRITALEARDRVRGQQIAEVEENVERKIDAYAMLEASAMASKIEEVN